MDEPLASQPVSQKPRTPRERLVTSDYDVFIKKTRKPETILVTPTPTVDTTNRLGRQTESLIVEESTPIQRPSSFSASQLLLNSLVFIALPAFMVSTLILYSKSASFEKRNQILFAETKQLRESLLSLEDLNKSLTTRFEKLKNEKKALSDKLALFGGGGELSSQDKGQYEKKLQEIREEKGYLEEMLINKTKEIERLKRASPGGFGETSGAGGSSDEEVRKLTEQNKMLTQRLERLYKTASDKLTEINLAKIALEETVAQAKDTLHEEWSSVDLGSITLESDAGAPIAQPTVKPQAKAVPKTQGRVLAVNEEHGFVVVNLGKVDNIKNDMAFSVNQDGRTIATLSVLEVRDAMSACNIKDLDSGRTIAVNDVVFLQ